MKKYNIHISQKANSMFNEHIRFLGQINAAASEKLIDDLMSAIFSLDILPERCPFIDEEYVPKKYYRKLSAAKYYIILFHIVDRTVHIDHIFNTRQDYQRLL